MKKRVLLISYHFPPDSAVGGLRAAKFARFLPSFGWEASVLSIKEKYIEKPDPKRLKDVEGIETIRTVQLPTIRGLYLRLKRLLNAGAKSGQSPSINKPLNNRQRESLIQNLKRYFISLFILLPDDKMSWVVPAALRAVLEVRRRGITHVFTSSPPHSTQLAGLIVKKLTGVVWVADFRDPWMETIDCKPAVSRSALSDRVELWLEGKVLRNADKVVTTTEAFRKSLEERYWDMPEDKFVYIPNGIDATKFAKANDTAKYERFTITYAGTIYEGRTPEPVFEAISALIAGSKIKRTEIRFKLVGNCDSIFGRDTLSIARSYGLDGVVEVSEPVPYHEALRMMRSSHLLLLLAPSQPLAVPAKVYDYLGSGTRILALTEEGATSDLIRATGSGRCYTQTDIAGISGYILETMRGKDGIFEHAHKSYSQFDIRFLTKRLAEELESAESPIKTGSVEVKNGI